MFGTGSKVFSPDQRNLGGRRVILAQMLQHLHHVESAKSTINKLPQQTPIRRTPSPMFKFIDQYKEVMNTFEKVQKIQQKRPSVEKFKNNYFLKKVNIKNTEHLKNVERCKKRIEEMNQKPDKKNHFNHTVYPALFFRRLDKSLINKTTPPIVIQHQQPKVRKYEISQDVDWEKIAKQVPILADPKQFKQTIVDLIIKNRIYSDDDYAFFVCLISSVNIKVEQSKIIELFNEALAALESC